MWRQEQQQAKNKSKKKKIINMQNWLMCLFQACFVLFKVELIVGFFG